MSHIRDEADFAQMVHRKRIARMERIDAMSPELRELVHEYGFNVVNCCASLGVTRPRHIRHLVETILDEFSPTRGSFSKQGIRTEAAPPTLADE